MHEGLPGGTGLNPRTMVRPAALLAAVLALVAPTLQARILLASNGTPRVVVVVDPAAEPPVQTAASELQSALGAMTGAPFAQVRLSDGVPERAILVGPGTAARALFPDVPFDRLGPEEFVLVTRGDRLLIAGGAPRGTLYGVVRFLQTQCGVRWWTPWAARIPRRPVLSVPRMRHRDAPAFVWREPYFWHTRDAAWAVHNTMNGHSANIPAEWGGGIPYAAFVHTFGQFVTPADFDAHPEWFALVGGHRAATNAQLCLTAPGLPEHLAARITALLESHPDARVVSLSQADTAGWCECTDCRALARREGSESGPLLACVNAVAARLRPRFPGVLLDTIAYQATRPPPSTLRPARNVAVRFCPIEADQAAPLTAPSNAGVLRDLRGWSTRARHLHVWDYHANFAHLVAPQPGILQTGANLRTLRARGVESVFAQGSYGGPGAGFAELRAWVLAQLMWDPDQDTRALALRFLDGYHGPAAPRLAEYLDTLERAGRARAFGVNTPPRLPLRTLARLDRLARQAVADCAEDAEFAARARIVSLGPRYALLASWNELRAEAARTGASWPFPESRAEVAAAFLKDCAGEEARPWTVVTELSEKGLSPEDFVAALPPER
jgi:hypothetical protein